MRKISLSICLMLLVTLFIGCRVQNDTSLSLKENRITELPKIVDFENYIIEIEDIQLFKECILLQYSITSKDGSSISNKDISVNFKLKNNTVYGGGNFEILTEQLSKDKIRSYSQFIIAAKSTDWIDIDFFIDVQRPGLNEEPNIGSYHLKENKNDYEYINKKVSIDGIDFIIKSIANFEFGSLLNFYTKNLDNDLNYSIKLKSNNYINTYPIILLLTFEKNILKDLNLTENYNDFDKKITIGSSPLIYLKEDINANNFELYLVNNTTNTEVLIYKK
ncbi:hypothetical protein [Clostridium tarantellae]|uniref:Lipoprotein n=1 Tax=Clostridium tarantellae TaxID=39493 RepID=A0A6I1MP70_9CLOT|nr:hypothetical protein [Clostridium tarantellae]MPQ44864.1 hypothetical protein [Clostridium tarantellae]